METIKDILSRLAYKTTGFKSLFTIAVLASLWLHDFSDANVDALIALMGFVLGAKAVQYVADAVVLRGKGGDDGEA
jgi:hypothetical protein